MKIYKDKQSGYKIKVVHTTKASQPKNDIHIVEYENGNSCLMGQHLLDKYYEEVI